MKKQKKRVMKTVNVDEEDKKFEDERGGFSKSNKRIIQGGKAFVFLLLILIIIFIGWIIFNKVKKTKSEKKPQTKVEQKQNLPKLKLGDANGSASPFSRLFGSDVRSQVPDSSSSKTDTPTPTPETSPQVTSQITPQMKKKEQEEKANERRLSASTLAEGGSSDSPLLKASKTTENDDGNDDNELNHRLHSSAMQSAKASIMKNQSLTIASGTIISCGTTTELDTTHAGMVSCQVSRDVYSVDHHVRLIDKGAHIDGQITGGMSEGQKRVFVLWTRLRNPDGVVVNLDSPATSPLGGTGIEGSVNSHFFKRFGAAIMVSIISDMGQAGIQMAGNAFGSANNRINLGNTNSNTSQMENQVLQNTMKIPPTLYDQQGDAVAVYVARDLDFSDVYGLKYAE